MSDIIRELADNRADFTGNEIAEMMQDVSVDDIRQYALETLIDLELENPRRIISSKLDEALAKEENNRQRAVVQAMNPHIPMQELLNPTQGTRIGFRELARDLLGDGKLQKSYPNSILASKAKGNILGIDGPVKPDSEIRVFNEVIRSKDPETGEDVFGIRKVGVPTEYLSPDGVERVFQDYLRANTYPNQANRFHYNAFAGEYYGQQGMKLAGYAAPSDDQRSESQQRLYYQNPSRVMGTDRLIETSPGLTAPEVGGQPADYRYVTPQGEVRVGDYQTIDVGPQQKLKLNLAKNVKGGLRNSNAIERELLRRMPLQKPEALDKAFVKATEDGVLPPLRREMRGQSRGYRAGKIMSDAEDTGIKNRDQFRYQDILFGVGPRDHKQTQYGMIPKELYIGDTGKLREVIGRAMIERSLNNDPDPVVVRGPSSYGDKIDAQIPVDRLINGTRSVRPLLGRQLMTALSEPFRL